MDGLQALFAELYNRFLLRDFVGKIVPGGVLLLSVAALFRKPSQIFADVQKLTKVLAIYVAGFTWIMTLGVQNVAEWTGAWGYFPYEGRLIAGLMLERTTLLNHYGINTPRDFGEATEQMLRFQAEATEGQKLQYERFVVIKEASGNLFATVILSLPALVLVILRRHDKDDAKGVRIARLYAGGLALLVTCGLFRMHWQHVSRQWTYATTIAAAVKEAASKATPADCTAKVRARLRDRGYEAQAIDDICRR